MVVNGQRAAGLRFGDRRALALLHGLCLFAGPPTGFRQRDIRSHVAALQGRSTPEYGPGALSSDLRRLRLHALIERIPKTHRCRVTATGLRTALFFVRLYARAPRPALAWDDVSPASRAGHAAYQRLEHAMDADLKEVHLAA